MIPLPYCDCCFYLKIVEVVLHELVQIVAEEDLELVLELVWLWQRLEAH